MRVATLSERWFGWALHLFVFAWPLAVATVIFAPVTFVRVLGAVALVASMLGMATSLAGLRHVCPSRWRALRREVRGSLQRVRAPKPG